MAEIAAIAEHVASLTAAAAAFQLQPDVPGGDGAGLPSTVPLLDETNAPEAGSTLANIRGWASHALAIDHVPGIWRAFAHHPRLLDAVWRKHQLVLGAGALDQLAKGCAALAVAQFRQSPYWIAYLTRFLRASCGLDDRALVELTAMMMHSLSFNTIAHGMRLEAPFENLRAADFGPGGRLENSRRPAGPVSAATPS